MAYPLEYGDSPDTAAFNAINRPRLGYTNVVARNLAGEHVGTLRYIGGNTYAALNLGEAFSVTGEVAHAIYTGWQANGYRLMVI